MRTILPKVRETKGFSLVELLVVVSVVALLAAIMLPGLARAREYAYFTKCKGHMRQIGLGFLTFAADNKGKIPRGLSPCNGGSSGVSGPAAQTRRLGQGPLCYVGHWEDLSPNLDDLGRCPVAASPLYDMRSATILEDICTGPIGGGQNWAENISGSTKYGYVGYPRRAGKYLPLDILWDPIIIVREWKPWGTDTASTFGAYDSLDGTYKGNEYEKVAHPGTEHGRDFLSRTKGGHGVFGYEFFTYSVGCAKNVHDIAGASGTGDINDGEQPFRHATNHKDMTAFHKPSTWIASCIRPVEKYKWCSGCDGIASRDFLGHFGCREVVPQLYRFNVLHLDGVVDDEYWMEYLNQSDDWHFERTSGDAWMKSPYGWRFKDPSSISGAAKGIELIPGFPRAFDEGR